MGTIIFFLLRLRKQALEQLVIRPDIETNLSTTGAKLLALQSHKHSTNLLSHTLP